MRWTGANAIICVLQNEQPSFIIFTRWIIFLLIIFEFAYAFFFLIQNALLKHYFRHNNSSSGVSSSIIFNYNAMLPNYILRF